MNDLKGGSWIHSPACYCHLVADDKNLNLSWELAQCATGEGNGTPLQCSYLENPTDGGAWWAAVYGVAQSRTRLKRLSSSSSSQCLTGLA